MNGGNVDSKKNIYKIKMRRTVYYADLNEA